LKFGKIHFVVYKELLLKENVDNNKQQQLCIVITIV
jgi:hypothetical protein